MKHLKDFSGFKGAEATNEELLDMFKSDTSKGFAIATQDINFKQFVQQGLDPKSGKDGKPLKRQFDGVDLSDTTKSDFLSLAKTMKENSMDYKSIKNAVKSNDKLKKIFDYICARGSKNASFTSSGGHKAGTGAGPTGDKYKVNKDLDPVSIVNACRERVEKEPVTAEKKIAPISKLEKFENKRR
jgi:hypothetical protein